MTKAKRIACVFMALVLLSVFSACNARQNSFIYKHVVIVGIDGAGSFIQNCNTPNIDSIFIKNGASTYTCHAAFPSMSAECWGAMFTGVKPELHKLTNDTTKVQPYTNADYPTIFKLVRETHPDAKIGAFCNWSNINTGIIEQDINIDFDTAETDSEVCSKACDYITENKPELFFIQFDEVDGAGHHQGFASESYYTELEQADVHVSKIYNAIKDAGIMDDTLFIVTADHGGINLDHGGNSDAEMNTFFAAAGKTVNKTYSLNILGRDIAAIVCYALNVNGNENWDSYVPQSMFTDSNNLPARSDVDFN